MTLYVIAKSSKLGVTSTLESNVEGAPRLYQLPALDRQAAVWSLGGTVRIPEASTGQPGLRTWHCS